MPIGPARMPLFDHLGELRMRLVRIVVSLFIAMCVFYMATPTIIQFMCLIVIISNNTIHCFHTFD